MSKLVPLLFAGAGTATVSVGGFYLVKGSGSGILDGSPESPSSTTVQNLEFDTVEAFKKGMQNSDCVKNYFGEIVDKPEASDISSSSPDAASFFRTPSSGTYQSCLFINGKVTSYSGDKWNGKFTGLGTFMIGDEGFITFNIAESSTEHDGKLKFSGVFYLVGKQENDSQKWEIKHKKNIENNKEADKDNLDTYFPRAADDLKDAFNGEYWGFISDKSKWEKSCKNGSCGDASTPSQNPTFISRKLFFSKGTETSKKLSDGSSGLDWGTNLYSGISGSLKSKTDTFIGKGTSSST